MDTPPPFEISQMSLVLNQSQYAVDDKHQRTLFSCGAPTSFTTVRSSTPVLVAMRSTPTILFEYDSKHYYHMVPTYSIHG